MATQQQPVTYLAPSDSSIDNTDAVILTGASQGPPMVFIEQQDAIDIEATPWVA